MRVEVLGDRLPAARWILRVLRDEATEPLVFREWMKRAGVLLGFEASRSLPWRSVRVRTPLGVEAEELEPEKPPLIVGVLGAALPLVEGFSMVYPGAPVGLVAARRIEEGDSVRVEVYYERLPESYEGPGVIVDPMLATGYTIARVAEGLTRIGARPIVVASVIASKPGVSYIASTGMVDAVYTLALDPLLDDRFFIVPGLGDAGDRALSVSP